MAIYHLSVKPMSRKGGRSATAAIAYRTAEKIHDLTSDQVFDYTRKRGVEHTEIVLPTAAAKLDINWARDRQALWNAAEMAEKRKDSRVAREYEVALPHELKAEQRVELVQAFAAELANRYGVAVDFAIHKPHRNGDERNHHAHIMTTTREITATGLGRKTDIELGDRDRAKKGLASGADEIEFMRERWKVLANEHLLAQGIEARIDHRSLAAQGIDREPTSHLGPAVSGMERRGMETEVGQRLEVERAQAVQERLSNAAELVAVVREQQALKVSLFELSAMAPRQRERKAATPERAPEAEATAAQRLMAEVQARAQRLDAERAAALTQHHAKSEGLSLELGATPAAEREAAARDVEARPEQPAASTLTAKMSLAEQLELLSNEVAERLDREAHPQRGRGIEADAFRRQRGIEGPGQPSSRADRELERDGRRAAGPEGDAGGGDVGQRRLQPPDGSNELNLAEQLHARADEVARRVEREMAQDRAARAQRAEVERQRVLKVTQEKQIGRDRGRSLGRSPGDDDGPKRTRGRDLGFSR